jgi:fumarate hydratase class II
VRIAKAAIHDRITLKQAAEQLGLVTPADFDRWVQPAAMTSPGATLAGG